MMRTVIFGTAGVLEIKNPVGFTLRMNCRGSRFRQSFVWKELHAAA
jgi:hypothetical protein